MPLMPHDNNINLTWMSYDSQGLAQLSGSLRQGFSALGIGTRRTMQKTSAIEGAIKLQVVLLSAVKQLCLINYLIIQHLIALT